ncbi:unnamed protein product [Cuscuta epithymum]|uniref:Protein MIZU-KUSSEI 1 n=1 Tax=Cuscuta epithymum TaxID=186058 RepID=A0AAV0C552_9ASTE|nr:unnamed protein product [Cuscuta epithymum]
MPFYSFQHTHAFLHFFHTPINCKSPLYRSWPQHNNKIMKTEHHGFTALTRSSSCKQSSGKIVPSSYYYQRSTSHATSEDFSDRTPIGSGAAGGGSSPVDLRRLGKITRINGVSALLRSFLNLISFPAACSWLHLPTRMSVSAPPLGRKVAGTLFGHRRGHVSFTVQDDPRSEPALVIELPVTTSALVKEMASGLVRIALECEKAAPSPTARRGGGGGHAVKLFQEPVWTMYLNGRKCGYAQSRPCTASDWHVLSTVQSVSVGAGVIPVVEDGGKGGGVAEGELLYMRARFERVVGSRDSEAFYMMNPDGNGGPELSIFLLRI